MKRSLATLALAAILIQSCSTPRGGFPAPVKREPSAVPGVVWTVSGYLHSDTSQKTYVTIRGNKIEKVSTTKPASGNIVETEATIFPGFMDMHGHVKYNILPLWGLAKGQFLNRFEWRTKYAPYKDAVSANMKGVRGEVVCAAVKWAEVKAAAGGATAIQGIGGDSKCAKDYLVNNIEIPDDFDGNKIRAMTDMVLPDLVGSVFVKYIEPEMKKGLSYEKAYQKMLDDQKVTAWVDFFSGQPHSVGNGLKLLIGDDFGLSGSQMSQGDFDSVVPKIKAYLAAEPYNVQEKQVQKQLDAMKKWLFGDANGAGYIKAKKDGKAALDFLSKGGVLTISSSIRRYIGMFETSVRQSALNYFAESGSKAIIAHVAEGMRKDAYNSREYRYAQAFGLNHKGLVVIHGVGLDGKDLADAASNEISIVWSPFSNLLLYGETLDVAAAKKAGVNLTLGSDWTPTGSKNIMDEMKIAKRYIKKKQIAGISDKDIVDMVTVNAARALQMDEELGEVKQGYLANLTMLDCKAWKNAYECALSAEAKDVSLVVANGQGIYGDTDSIESVSRFFGDKTSPEALPRNTPSSAGNCDFKKSVRFQGAAPTVAQLEQDLNAALKKSESKNQKAWLDPLFKCEDPKYAQRFDAFIEKEIDQNAAARPSNRRNSKLVDEWTPFTLTGEDGGDQE